MIEILNQTAGIAGYFFMLFGMFIFFAPIIKKREPMDKSNVWNGLIAVVYVAFRPYIFGNIKFFQNDIGENIRLVEKAVREENERKS
jgi:hypothetical protein